MLLFFREDGVPVDMQGSNREEDVETAIFALGGRFAAVIIGVEYRGYTWTPAVPFQLSIRCTSR